MITSEIQSKITTLYGESASQTILKKIEQLLQNYGDMSREDTSFLSEKDIFLITYGDSLTSAGLPGFVCLNHFVKSKLEDLISIVHILPCFPWTSDDGFSVVDYRAIHPELGNWDHVDQLAQHVDLCFDFVLNHCSSESHYFKGFLDDDPHYKNFFIELDPDTDTSSVLRPRTLPLIHDYESASGTKYCWTTFSRDQLDINFKNPDVLIEMLDILLFYAKRSARMVRLDAIAYLWKELGTSCAHLTQTHMVVQLFRDILNLAARHLLILTETNVPHKDNISYFGDGSNEAQVVYNFPLPPLILHTLSSQDSTHLTRWAKTIQPISDQTTFLNFTASHDGIGVRPVADILSQKEFDELVELTTRHNGNVSYKNDSDGTPIPYELNINYFDAINNPNDTRVDVETQVDRFMLSQAIVQSLLGMPAIYIHSLLGSRNWLEGVEKTGHNRTINREKLDIEHVINDLDKPTSLRSIVFGRFQKLISVRKNQKAFHPNATQEILDLGPSLFGLKRCDHTVGQTIIAIYNVTQNPQEVVIPDMSSCKDLLSHQSFEPDASGKLSMTLLPYQTFWLDCKSH